MWIAHTKRDLYRAICARVCACLWHRRCIRTRAIWEYYFDGGGGKVICEYAFFFLSATPTYLYILAPIMERFHLFIRCGRGKTLILCSELRRAQITLPLWQAKKLNEWMKSQNTLVTHNSTPNGWKQSEEKKNNKLIWLEEVITIKSTLRLSQFTSAIKKQHVGTQSVSNTAYWDALQENDAIPLKSNNWFHCMCAIMHLGIKCAIKTPCALGCTFNRQKKSKSCESHLI